VKQFKVGERVVFLYEPGGGVITKIENTRIYVEDETGFERPFLQKDLGKIYGTKYPLQYYQGEGEIKEKQKNKQNKRYIQHKNYWEIDLHIDDQPITEPTHEHVLDQQMRLFKEFYWEARQKKVRRLIVIHGFGKGILRKELHLFLISQSGVDFFDAPYIQYGHGAIQVEIRYKW